MDAGRQYSMSLSRNVYQKAVSFFCLIALSAGLAAGCGTAKGAPDMAELADSIEKDKSSPVVELKVVLGYQDELPPENHVIVQELDKLAKADIRIEWTPMISYSEKFVVMMYSNALPDVILVPDTKIAAYVNAVNADMFWEIGSRFGKYTYLKEFNPTMLKNASIDGKLYIIPRERVLKRKMAVYRNDWAREAGLNPPDSISSLYAMAKAFGDGDFDKNGKKDTVGFALGTVNSNEIEAFDALVAAFGGVNKWGLAGGKIIPNFMTPEYLETAKWLRQMYAEGLISPDFAITKTTQVVPDLVDRELTGLWLSYSTPTLTDPLLKKKQGEDPELTRSDLFNFAFLKGPDGKERIAAESGFNGGFAFPKLEVKSEERLESLLQVFDTISSPVGQRLMGNGIEGLHYKVVYGKYAKIINPDLFKKDAISSIGQLGTIGTYMYPFADDELAMNLTRSRSDTKNSDMIQDPTTSLFSEAYSAKKVNLDNIHNEALINFILGRIDEDQFKKAVEQWKMSGGDKVIEEYTAAYYKSVK
jgi:putative aldouronate transport system substrate-binding protein